MKTNFVLRLLRDGKIEPQALRVWLDKTGREYLDPIHLLQTIFASRIALLIGTIAISFAIALIFLDERNNSVKIASVSMLMTAGVCFAFFSRYLRFNNGNGYWESIRMYADDYLLLTAIYHLRFAKLGDVVDLETILKSWTVNDLIRKGYRIILANGVYSFDEMREVVFRHFYPASIQIPMTPAHVPNPKIDRIREIIERFDMKAISL